ncbi:hypothetical protein CDAR_23051 [Caerostris darwini]|uniref:Uncharacterized protein n=1 Tax=Caerostris darwini TaxID=1538125 RepID=A0AAV4W1J9_9ARAC|nr:hypothetical protein CDAR_23051 [Caerostris darwini]
MELKWGVNAGYILKKHRPHHTRNPLTVQIVVDDQSSMGSRIMVHNKNSSRECSSFKYFYENKLIKSKCEVTSRPASNPWSVRSSPLNCSPRRCSVRCGRMQGRTAVTKRTRKRPCEVPCRNRPEGQERSRSIDTGSAQNKQVASVQVGALTWRIQ